ncbi:PLD nuclease N-terminal domain-containing protein [Streptomyces sp. NPDC046215]
MLRILPFLLILALWIYTFVDCLNTPEKEVRGLPKIAWVLIILLFGEVLLGPVAWLLAGRPRGGAGPRPYGRRGGGGRGWVAPDDNPEFLKSLKPDEKKDDGPPGDTPPAG